LPIVVKQIGIIWNRSQSSKEIDGIDIFGHIPYDKVVCDASMQANTVFDLANDSPAFSAAWKIFEDILVLSSQATNPKL